MPVRECVLSLGRKSGISPASILCWRTARRASSSWRRGSNSCASLVRNARASGVRTCVSTSLRRAMVVVISVMVRGANGLCSPLGQNGPVDHSGRGRWTMTMRMSFTGVAPVLPVPGKHNMQMLTATEMTRQWHIGRTLERHEAPLLQPASRSACGDPCKSNTRWRGLARNASGRSFTTNPTWRRSVRSPAIRRCSRCRPG